MLESRIYYLGITVGRVGPRHGDALHEATRRHGSRRTGAQRTDRELGRR
jgi:hypothetical protein